ncbi:DUF397 domain-containing protein [Streptomyces sp. NPDC005774]|uniref:DUF397 domain-containing protein n=1 Tax=Streptomyces sp. NPDC005774 TaxID=3364728 RepID=UPI0036B1F792
MSGDKARSNVDGLAWFKSSYSAGDGGQCVEVAAGSGVLYVRDSKDKTGPMASLAPEAWADFVGFAARHAT